MENRRGNVVIIDDDESVRKSVALLLSSAGYSVEIFSGAQEFFRSDPGLSPGCILLDIFLEGESGLEVQEEIASRFPTHPIIYMSGFGDIPMSVRALRKGAINFLQKPFQGDQLIEAVDEALLKSHEMIMGIKETDHLRLLFDTLTPREKAVFKYIIRGFLNKQIASELDITEHTVKIHRGKITEKLGVKSVAEIVQIAGKLKMI